MLRGKKDSLYKISRENKIHVRKENLKTEGQTRKSQINNQRREKEPLRTKTLKLWRQKKTVIQKLPVMFLGQVNFILF